MKFAIALFTRPLKGYRHLPDWTWRKYGRTCPEFVALPRGALTLGRWRYIPLGFIIATLAWAAPLAETLIIPLGQQQLNSEKTLPRKGETMASVQNRLGEAIKISPPVGKPPITTWEYGDFFVYFEYDQVVHTVIKFRPQHPEALDQP